MSHEDPHVDLDITVDTNPIVAVPTSAPSVSDLMELPAICSASTTPANPATSTPITAVSTKVLNFDKEIIPEKVTSSSAAESSPSQGESDSEMDEDDILGFDIDSFNVLSKENPAAAMESLASSKGSRSTKTQHSTTASETSEAESAKWAPYVEKLKDIIMEPNFFQSLAVGADVQEILNLIEQVKTNIRANVLHYYQV